VELKFPLSSRDFAGYSGLVKLISILACCFIFGACATTPGAGSSAESPIAGSPASIGAQSQDGSQIASSTGPEKQEQELAAPPLAPSMLVAQALGLLESDRMHPGTLPVRKNGVPLSVVTDVNGDGFPDVVLLTVSAGKPADAQFSALSRLSLLFSQTIPPPSYDFVVYVQKNGSLRQFATIPLGEKPVLEGMSALPVGSATAHPEPVVVTASFQNSQGEEQEWAVFSGSGSFSRLSLINTTTIHSVVRDIDNDGVPDVLVFHAGAEAGVGYETLITWYKFHDGSFVEFKTINIVRNLREFLSESRRKLADSDWGGFLEEAVAPEILAGMRQTRHDDRTIIASLFRPVSNGVNPAAPFDYFLPKRVIRNVVFPEIRENPFPDPNHSSSFAMTVRIVCCEGESELYSATVSMLPNPFGNREFSFTVD